jgi:hypothetical protein
MSFQQQTFSETRKRESEPSATVLGFVIFAGVILILTGILWFFEGLAAVIQDDFFVIDGEYAYDLDISTWGWLHMAGGVILALAGLFIFSGNIIARMIGIVVAVLAAVANFFFIPYYPVWSLLIIALCIGVIWALTVHGDELAEP